MTTADSTVPPTAPAAPDRASERRRWAANVKAWSRWADPIAELAQRLNTPLLHAAHVEAGHWVLDLASGVGEPALSIARRVGPDGAVTGTDLVPAMLATAAQRARVTGAANVAFAAADMEALPFPAGHFDRVTCRFGIMFAPSPVKALADIHRVLRPGGRLAVMVWGPRADNTLFREVGAAVEAAVHYRADALTDFATLFRFAEPGSLNDALATAGYGLIEEHSLKPIGRVPANRPFWQATLEMTFAPVVDGLDEWARSDLERDIVARFQGLAEDGTVPLHLHARIVAAVRPT